MTHRYHKSYDSDKDVRRICPMFTDNHLYVMVLSIHKMDMFRQYCMKTCFNNSKLDE